MPELRENLARALAQLHVAAWRFAGGQRFHGFEILRRGEESLHHDAPVLAPLIDIGQPCLHAIHGPAAKLFPGGVLSKYAFGAQADQLLAVDLDQIRSEEHTSELQSRENLVCRLLLEKKKNHSVSE